jgi:hypothetical protein
VVGVVSVYAEVLAATAGTDPDAAVRGDVAVAFVAVIILAGLALTRAATRSRVSAGRFPIIRVLFMAAVLIFAMNLIFGAGHP